MCSTQQVPVLAKQDRSNRTKHARLTSMTMCKHICTCTAQCAHLTALYHHAHVIFLCTCVDHDVRSNTNACVFKRNFTLISMAICLSPRMTSPSTSTSTSISSSTPTAYSEVPRIGRMADSQAFEGDEPHAFTESFFENYLNIGSTRISATNPWIWRSKTSSQRICWLHHCRTGARGKCRPTTTSLSLAQRKLGDRLVQISIQHG